MSLHYIYGYHPILAALANNSLVKIRKILLVHDKYPELKPTLIAKGIKYELVSLQTMNNLLKTAKHQNIAASVKPYEYFSLEAITKLKPRNQFLRYLILERISDPHNFGAMLRIAAGNDFDAVIVLSRNQAEINGAVAKAAAGALSDIPICQVANLTTTITFLQTKVNFWIFAAAKTKTAISYYDIDCHSNMALIIGNEGEGISEKLLKHSDFVVAIPMSNRVESFNASVACGIIANHIYCQNGNK